MMFSTFRIINGCIELYYVLKQIFSLNSSFFSVSAANQHAQERANTTHDKWTQNLTFFNISVIISMILLGILVAVLLYKGI